jgi:hypothetical protein
MVSPSVTATPESVAKFFEREDPLLEQDMATSLGSQSSTDASLSVVFNRYDIALRSIGQNRAFPIVDVS